MAKEKKGVNPADAFRKEQRKKELKKQKKHREVVREVRDLLNHPDRIDEEIARVQRQSDENRLDKSLKDRILELKRMKEVAMKKVQMQGGHPSATTSSTTSSSTSAAATLGATTTVSSAALPRPPPPPPRRPEESVYFHPLYNPSGRPPPGQPQMYRPPPPPAPHPAASAAAPVAQPLAPGRLVGGFNGVPLPPPRTAVMPAGYALPLGIPPPPPPPATAGRQSRNNRAAGRTHGETFDPLDPSGEGYTETFGRKPRPRANAQPEQQQPPPPPPTTTTGPTQQQQKQQQREEELVEGGPGATAHPSELIQTENERIGDQQHLVLDGDNDEDEKVVVEDVEEEEEEEEEDEEDVVGPALPPLSSAWSSAWPSVGLGEGDEEEAVGPSLPPHLLAGRRSDRTSPSSSGAGGATSLFADYGSDSEGEASENEEEEKGEDDDESVCGPALPPLPIMSFLPPQPPTTLTSLPAQPPAPVHEEPAKKKPKVIQADSALTSFVPNVLKMRTAPSKLHKPRPPPSAPPADVLRPAAQPPVTSGYPTTVATGASLPASAPPSNSMEDAYLQFMAEVDALGDVGY